MEEIIVGKAKYIKSLIDGNVYCKTNGKVMHVRGYAYEVWVYDSKLNLEILSWKI